METVGTLPFIAKLFEPSQIMRIKMLVFATRDMQKICIERYTDVADCPKMVLRHIFMNFQKTVRLLHHPKKLK